MPIMKEWRCRGHGPFENATGKCPGGCSKSLVTREFRTAPSLRRSGTMKFIDQQLVGIAKDNGLTDLRHGGEGTSVLETMKPLSDHVRPRWGDVPHAKPGFSREEGGKPMTVNAATFGTKPSAISQHYNTPPPPPHPIFVGKPRD